MEWKTACWIGVIVLYGNVPATAQPQRNLPTAPTLDGSAPVEMKPYAERIEPTRVTIEMLPIRGGRFLMGSPDSERQRKPDEGPQHEVKVGSFWMSRCEITWDAFEVWMYSLDVAERTRQNLRPTPRDKAAMLMSCPSSPPTDLTFGMGKKGYPAIGMTQYAAKLFCRWLSAKTGRYYRLPTEAEWEYACRAGTATAWSSGNDASRLGEYAWYFENSEEKYHKVGTKKPNPWGLHDMHGNVAEWVLDGYRADTYSKRTDRLVTNPLVLPQGLHPRVVRGGSWNDDPDRLRSAARLGSPKDWQRHDPQSMVFMVVDHVGFRIVRPLETPNSQEKKTQWEADPLDDEFRALYDVTDSDPP